jgi:hypothetical protein
MRETPESSRLRHEESSQPDDGRRHQYCIFCRAEKVRKVTEDAGTILNAALRDRNA